jgi:hypothetical protein
MLPLRNASGKTIKRRDFIIDNIVEGVVHSIDITPPSNIEGVSLLFRVAVAMSA